MRFYCTQWTEGCQPTVSYNVLIALQPSQSPTYTALSVPHGCGPQNPAYMQAVQLVSVLTILCLSLKPLLTIFYVQKIWIEYSFINEFVPLLGFYLLWLLDNLPRWLLSLDACFLSWSTTESDRRCSQIPSSWLLITSSPVAYLFVTIYPSCRQSVIDLVSFRANPPKLTYKLDHLGSFSIQIYLKQESFTPRKSPCTDIKNNAFSHWSFIYEKL